MKNVLITPGKSSFPLALMPRSRTAFFMGVPNREMITAKNTKFLGLEILWEGTVPAQFQENCPKIWEICTFPQNFDTRKLGEITVFFTVGVKIPVHETEAIFPGSQSGFG